MTKTVRIYGVDVEFTDQAPGEDGLYLIMDGEVQDEVRVDNGYIETSGVMPSETNWLWSSRMVPSDHLTKAHELLQKACAELPVSYYPDNTPEKLASNIAGFVKDYTENYGGMENALTYLTAITSGHFYQSSCRGGEMERLMNQAIEALGGKQ